MNHVTAIFASAAIAVLATPAVAQSNQANLSYDPAELATPEGAEAVYKRIKVSAKRACETSTPLLKRDQFRCTRELEGQLVTQTRSPILMAMHDEAQTPLRMAKAD